MIYTQQKRRAYNKAAKNMFADTGFIEPFDGIPVMECNTLPNEVTSIHYEDSFFADMLAICTRQTGMGKTFDESKVIPVFIESIELNGKQSRRYWRVNYVSPQEKSMEEAARYIKEGKLYAEKTLRYIQCNP